MLVGANNGGVDEQMFHIGVAAQGIGHALPDTGFAPVREPHIRTMPVSQFCRQIAPRAAGAHAPQYGLDEPPVVFGRAAGIAGLARQQVFNAFPLVIAQHLPVHPDSVQKSG